MHKKIDLMTANADANTDTTLEIDFHVLFGPSLASSDRHNLQGFQLEPSIIFIICNLKY